MGGVPAPHRFAEAPVRHRIALYPLAALVVAGCNCRGTPVQKQYGDLVLVTAGEQPHPREAEYDFGAVFMGQTKQDKIVIRNAGNGPLVIDRVEYVSGDRATIAGVLVGERPAKPVFEIQFAGPLQVDVSGNAELDILFSPPRGDDDRKVVEHELVLYLRTSNEETGEPGKLTLKGRAVSGVCDIGSELHFGSVAVNDSGAASFTLRNPSQLEATATVGDVYGNLAADRQAFTFAPGSPRGSFTLAPNSERSVTLQFTPTEQREYQAWLDVKASEQCPKAIVKLIGKGVESVLTWSPTPLNFLYVTPGAQVTRTLTFKNEGNRDVQLTQLKTGSGEYRVVPEGMAEPTSLVVPALGEKQLTIAFKPSQLGYRNSTLTFSTSLPKQSTGSCSLLGVGGGPDIDVKPFPTLSFGKVAYFPNANTFQTRKLTVFNVGTTPGLPDPAANLRLTSLVVKTATRTEDGTFEVSFPPGYDPALGVVATPGSNLLPLVVKVTPRSLGTKEADVTLLSNDPDEPAVTVHLVADALELPPCRYSVTPSVVSFGLITPPSYRELSFDITNLGQGPGDECLLSGLDLSVDSSDIFSLPSGPIAARTLAPKETLHVLVRAWPQKLDALPRKTGTVEFFMSSNVKPQGAVSLDARVGTSCVTILPEEINFGTVQRGCSSTSRTVTVYNTCNQNGGTDILLNSIVLQAAAGQPAGGADCPGPAPCPELSTFHAPLPAGGLVIPKPDLSGPQAGVAKSFSFGTRYRPIDLGTDTGAVAITLTVDSQPVTFVVALNGKGDTQGENIDTFRQDIKPKADILLVIDSSCSMADKQLSLSMNFAAFIKYAESRGVDYHIAVTTTDMEDANFRGRFVSGLGHPEKVLTPTTVDVANKFKAKVNVGTGGSGTERQFAPAHAALTAPLILGENADFLRDDANLAIIGVSDAKDQSAQTAAFYLNAFLNIKGFKRANMFTFNSIGPYLASPPSPCSYDLDAPDDGRLRNMVLNTNGVREEICTPDWARTLEQLSKIAFGYRTNFFLSSLPDLTGGKEPQVSVNGVVLTKTDPRGATVWTYDPVANSVNFEPLYVPEPGQTLNITYQAVCVP